MNALARLPSSVTTASLDYPAFKVALVNACKVIDAKARDAVCRCVLVEHDPAGGIRLLGTDLDRYTSTFVPGEVAPGFAALLDAHRLKATMDKVKDAARINLVQEEDRITAAIGKLQLDMTMKLPASDFPGDQSFRTELGGSNCTFVLGADVLATALRKVAFAISTEETRYYLNGVYLRADDRRRKLTFVATDGHRLARYEVDLPAGAGAMPDAGVIVPTKAVHEMMRLLARKGCPDSVMLTVTPTGISFLVGEHELLESKVINGTYPDYGRVIPGRNPHRAAVSTACLITAIRQASSVLSGKSRGIRLIFGAGRVTLSCKDEAFGRTSVSMPALMAAEMQVEIGFNFAYLAEMLGHLDGGAMLEMDAEGGPMVCRDGADDAVTYVLMPMRV